MSKYKKSIVWIIVASCFLVLLVFYRCHHHSAPTFKRYLVGNYWVEERPTTKYSDGVNDVQAIILHHCASDTLMGALTWLAYAEAEVSSHVLIDKDGTRYLLAEPTRITWHAGFSSLHGREYVNEFAVGIEFLGDTEVAPLTDAQIASAIDYMLPIMAQYHIPIENVATHKQIRDEWLARHPERTDVPDKTDITQAEYERFMACLRQRLIDQ